jgi:hypothetical protein
VVGEGDRLEIRQVRPDLVMGNVAVVSKGLSQGDRLVVTDPSIAVPGMVVKPVEDNNLQAAIARAAQGLDDGPSEGEAGNGGNGPGNGSGKGAGKGSGKGAGGSKGE